MMSVEDDPTDILPTARLFWVAHHFRIVATFEDRYELECVDGYEYPRTLPRAKISDLRLSGDLVVEPFYFDIDGRPAKAGSHIDMLASRTPAEIRRTMIAFTKAKMFDRAYRAKKVVLYETQQAPKSGRRRRRTAAVTADVWLKQNEAAIHAACRPFYILDPKAHAGHEKPRLGQFAMPSLGSVSTLKKDRAKLARKGFRITDLCPNIDAMRNGGRQIADDMAAFTLAQIKEVMLRPERMTLSQFRKHLGAELRMMPEMALRSPPSVPAISRLIKTLDDARVIAAWFGEKTAIESRTIYTEGPQYTYPGELILMDGWKIDLVARLTKQGGWTFISDPELKEWGVRRRLFVVVAMDACSKAILGMAIGLSESSELTRRALRMAIADKTLQSKDAGCEGDPLPPIGLDGLLTDIGPAFKHPYFQVPALTLVSDADIGPGDSAHLRGGQERFNRTMKDQLLSYFTGTTFGNVLAKGDYDAMARASADVQTLGRGLWLWASDVYNRSPNRGLDDQTPFDRFHDTYITRGAADVYTEEQIRIAFGMEFLLPLTRQGICFASNRYWSGRLQVFFRDYGRDPNGGPRRLRAKIDPCDLGRISVYFQGEWHTLAGPARMRRVGLTDWLETREALAKKYGEQRAVHADIVAKALIKLERMGTVARMESQVKDMSYDSEEVVLAVRSIRLRIKEDEVPMRQGVLLALDSTTDEASFPATGEEFEDQIDAVEDPHADAGDNVRSDTDFGLDDVDIDQDGDFLNEPETDEEDEDEMERPPPVDVPAPPDRPMEPAQPATQRLEPLPQPTLRKKS